MMNTYENKMIEPCLYSCDSIVTKVNKEFIDLTGFSLEELSGKSILEIEKILKINSQKLLENNHTKLSIFIFTKSLQVREVEVSITQGQKLNEKIYCFTEKANSRLDGKLIFIDQTFKENLMGAAIYSVPDLILLKVNEKYLELIDFPYNSEEKIIGRSITGIPRGFEKDAWKEILESQKTNYIKECKLDKCGGCVTYWDLVQTPVFENRKMKYIYETAVEVTERVIINQNLLRYTELLNKNLKAVIENLFEFVFVFDKDGNFILYNSKSDKNYSNVEEAIIDFDLKGYKYYDEKGRESPFKDFPYNKIINGERIVKYKMTERNSSGEKFLCIDGRPVYNENNEFIFGIMSIEDVSEHVMQQMIIKSQQDILLRSERGKSETLEKAIEIKDEFLSIISHEFKTPLNVINAAIQALTLICGNELSDNAQKYIGMIRQNMYRQLRLVNNLLDITRANAGNIKIHKKNADIVFLTKSITESVYTIASQKGVNVTFASSVEKKVIGIDDEKYERIILNLLSNAIKFTSQGKSVKVKVHTTKGKVCIEVIDRGIGIPEDKMDLIFERFGQVDSSLSRQAEGTGIGLSLVKTLVEALGGTISVASKVGKGSKFTILLSDEKVLYEQSEKPISDLMDNRLVQVTTVELSDIYL